MLARTGTVFVVISLALAAAAPLGAHPSGRQGRRPDRKSAPPQATRPAAPTLAAQEAASGAYLTDEAKLTVRGAEHPVVRIGLAPSGVTVVEFPASDEFFAVHPPENGDWVEVEKSPSFLKESEKKTGDADDTPEATRGMLARATAEPKWFKRWSGPLHGLKNYLKTESSYKMLLLR